MNLNNLVIFLTCSYPVFCQNFTNEMMTVAYGENDNESEIDCVSFILNEYVPCNDSFTVFFSKANVNKLLKYINNNDCFNVRVRSFIFKDWLVKTNVYIIIVQEVNDFFDNMQEIAKDTLWNPKARFIFLFFNISHIDLQNIFELFAQLNIYKVILLNYINNNDVELHTYFPFGNNNCGKYFDKIINLGFCRNINDHNQLFPNDKELVTLHNCPISVVANDDIPNIISEFSNYTVFGKYINGLEQYLLDTIAAMENITIMYRYATADDMFGVVLPNRSTTGILHSLQNGNVTMAVGGFALIKNRIEVFDYIWGYNYAELLLLTPTNDENLWNKVYRTFGLQTWILIIFAYSLMSVFIFISRGLWSENHQDYFIINMKIWAYFYGQTDDKLLQDTKPKTIVIIWAMFAFFIFSFYNTAFFSLITGHVKVKKILKTDKIDTIPYEPCISDQIREFYEYAYNIKFPDRNDNPDCRYVESAMDTVASNKDLYSIQMGYSYKLREFKYLDEDGNYLMDSWNFSHDTVLTIYVTRGFPLKSMFQKYALYMYESGLLQKHLNLMYTTNLKSMTKSKQKFQRIHISDFRIHFAILMIGIIISVFCFIIEILKHKTHYEPYIE